MDVKRITKYFSEDYVLSKGDLLDVENVLSDFPFFQSLRFLYLKGWYTLDYQKFKEELDKMSILVSNREALFFYIFKEEFSYFLRSKKKIWKNDKTIELIDAFFDVTKTPIQDNLEIDGSTKNLATTDYLSFLNDIERKKSIKNQSKEKVNISTGLITLETIDENTSKTELLEENTHPVDIEVAQADISVASELISLEVSRDSKLNEEEVVTDQVQISIQEDNIVETEKVQTGNQSMILIESFNQLVADTLKSKGKVENVQDEDTKVDESSSPTLRIDDDQVGDRVLDSDLISIVVPQESKEGTNDVVEVKSEELTSHSESHGLPEEQIKEEDFNTIGSEEMSALITQRLEESLKMLQDLRRSAISESKKKEAIIDRFLSKEHKPINFDKSEIQKDEDSYTLEEDNGEEELDEAFFTETLAKIYTKQGRYDKAYEIIKHLSLKVSNKNAYFVEQLDYLEKLISKKNKIK